MRPIQHLLRGIAISATLAMALPVVAHAGQNDRAQQAIAEARGKISAGTLVGAGDEAIGLQTRAKASLNTAEALLSKGKKTEAIAAAQEAGMMADQALAMSSRAKTEASTAAVAKAEADADAAKQTAAIATQQAVAADARADMAMTQPAAPVAPATTTTTTVATAAPAVQAAPVVRKKTTHKTRIKPAGVATSTTVTTTQK